MNVPVVSHLKLLVNLYNKMNNRFLVLLVIYLIIYLLSVLYKNKQIFVQYCCRSSRGSVD